MAKQALTAALIEQIADYVRAGGYDWVAAEAAGIDKTTYHQWMRLGGKRRARQPYASLYRQVRQAKAQARLKAEIEVREKDPRFWLKSGPGKEQHDQPGWTSEVKPIIAVDNRSVNLLASPEWNSLWSTILQALSAFPEARMALIAALQHAEATNNPKQFTKLPP